MKLAAISIDLDETPQYCAIHGLPAPPARARWAMVERALPRLQELLHRRGLAATLFVIGKDLANRPARDTVRLWHSLGHEIGNHTQDHPYNLTRMSEPEMEHQVSACSIAIAEVTGQRPIGFRAPGYTVNDRLLKVLQALDLCYDSSVFPCPAYYLAKAAAMAGIRLRGANSRSVLDDPRVLRAPANPYRVGKGYRQCGSGLLELPIGVTRATTGRLPFIGTGLNLAGPTGAKLLTRAIVGRPLVNLELHAMDLACAEKDGLEFLAPHQPDLAVPLATKRRCLEVAIDGLIAHGYRFVTLAEATSHFGRASRAPRHSAS